MPYYQNLEAEMARIGLRRKDVARALGKTPETISAWMEGRESGFPVAYAFKLRDRYFPGLSIEELFKTAA